MREGGCLVFLLLCAIILGMLLMRPNHLSSSKVLESTGFCSFEWAVRRKVSICVGVEICMKMKTNESYI